MSEPPAAGQPPPSGAVTPKRWPMARSVLHFGRSKVATSIVLITLCVGASNNRGGATWAQDCGDTVVSETLEPGVAVTLEVIE